MLFLVVEIGNLCSDLIGEDFGLTEDYALLNDSLFFIEKN